MNGRRHGERGGRLARVAMCLGLAGALAVFMVGSGARAFERPAGVVAKSAPAPVWRTIALGTRKGVDGYRNALEAASMKIGDDADEILGRPAFPYASARIEHELVVLSVADLVVDSDRVPLSDLYSQARRLGLDLCPAEVGPQLRLGYRNQPRGEVLHVAMLAIATYDGRLTSLALSNFGGTLALIGSDGRPDFLAPSFFRFVFTLPGKKRLEVMNSP